MPRAYEIPTYQLALHFGGVRRPRLSGWRRWRWFLPWF
jgi:hypothetical protein